MVKTDVIDFFNRQAPDWDAGMVRDDRIINTILDNAGIGAGSQVLDVACGTGVLIPDYLSRNVKSVVGIDISPAMIEIAQRKYGKFHNVRLFAVDAEKFESTELFDSIVIYNAFPHFAEPEKLISHLSEYLLPGGRLTVAHGMSRARIDAHHSGLAKKVSVGLMDEMELAALFSNYLDKDIIVSNDKMYQVVGRKA